MLSTLDELRHQVDSLKKRVGVDQLPKDVLQAIEASLTANASTAAAAAGPPSLDDVVIRDIVVCAHPDRPPLAILVYFELLKQFFKVTGKHRAMMPMVDSYIFEQRAKEKKYIESCRIDYVWAILCRAKNRRKSNLEISIIPAAS